LKYYYRIKCVNNGYYSGYSKEIVVTTGSKQGFKDIKTGDYAKDVIEDLAGMGVFGAGADSNFNPQALVTRGEFISYLVKAFKLKATAVGSFGDVKANCTYYKEIMIANSMGIVAANELNYFYPNRFITREEIAAFLVRALKAVDRPLPAHETDILNAFPDKASISSWALKSMATVIGEKIMQGKTVDGNQGILLINQQEKQL